MSGFWDGRRVLVTGHTGFKGAWLSLWLHRLGARVTGFAAEPPTTPSLFAVAGVARRVDDVRGDVRDATAVRDAVAQARPEVVFHLAAQPIVRASLDDPAGTWDVNAVGLAIVLDAARDATLVCVTSDKCYAPRDDGRPHRESDALGGHDPYSASKAAQELLAASFRTSFGTRVATARAGNVIGGGDWARDRLVPDLVRSAAAGRPLRLRHPDAVRPWQHVLNPLSGYLLLAERLHESERWARGWNFGPAAADAKPVRWIVDRVRERWPVPVEVEESAGDVESPAVRLDASAARRRLGWKPRWDLAAGLDATVDWYDAERSGRDITLEQIEAFEEAA
jgi:CDP-glucose 4,6-dehydratase